MQTRWLGAIAVTVSCMASAGCAASPPQVEGRIASGGGYLGDWDLFPNDCQAASEGALLSQGGDVKRKVRIVDRSRGQASSLSSIEVRVVGETPKGPMEILLTDATCVTGSVHSSNGETAGNIRVDCRTGEGGHVVGELAFAHCR